MRRICTILCLVVLAAACSKESNDKSGILTSIANKAHPYAGDWVEIKKKDRIRIQPEGDAYVFIDSDGDKIPASVENDLLHVYYGTATLVGLKTAENDHLLIAGSEFERTTPMPFAEIKRTMTDMRSLATALEARATDTNTYVIDGQSSGIDGVASVLEPTYARQVPRNDGWQHAFAVRTTRRSYEIRSFGANGSEDVTRRGATQNPDCDIIFADGNFVSYPAGMGPQQ